MHKDFHLYGTYLAARLAGKNADDARIIAFAAQATDDFTYGEYASCQPPRAMLMEDMNILRTYWSVFHFLPSGIDTPQVDARKYVTRPEGLLFKKLIGSSKAINALMDENNSSHDEYNPDYHEYYLAYQGIAMHIIADTYAHQGFSGIPSRLNVVEDLVMCEKQHLNLLGENTHVPVLIGKIEEIARIGHGTAGNAPDLSWITFTYTDADCTEGRKKFRDNAVIFSEAFITLYEALGGDEAYSAAIRKSVNTFLRGVRNSTNKDKKASYYVKNDKCFENMLAGNTLIAAANSGRIISDEIDALENGYVEYIGAVNTLAKDYSSAKGACKTEKFKALSDNDFFAATIKARELIMSEIDTGFKEDINQNADADARRPL